MLRDGMLRLLLIGIVLVLQIPPLAYAQSALDVPGTGDTLSGIGVIHGWKCETHGPLTVRIDGGTPIPLLYGSERGDTRGVCGDTLNGFVAIYNWGILVDGIHTAVAYDGAREFARSTFEVKTLGEEFVVGLDGECTIPNFPLMDETTKL